MSDAICDLMIPTEVTAFTPLPVPVEVNTAMAELRAAKL